MRNPSLLLLSAMLSVTLLSGCFPTVYLPRMAIERVDVRLTPADPVFTSPGGGGPIWAPPEVTTPCCEDPCNSCGPCGQPSTPLQPVDPFGWIRAGDRGTHVMDPIGWVIGI